MNGTALLSFSQEFGGVVWKIRADAAGRTIAIETRDASSRSAFISAFNFETGQCYFKERPVDNGWLFTLDEVSGSTIYLHGFKNEQSPERKGIIALDLQTGGMRWQKHHLVLSGITGKGPVVYDFSLGEGRTSLLSADTGDPAGAAAGLPVIFQDIIYPEPLSGHLLTDQLNLHPEGPVWVARHGEKTCLCFHIATAEGFSQILLIAENDRVITQDYLATGIQKLNPEAFFILQDHVFCLRNKNEIVSYLL